jgi:O-antigen/teichoic acid export membrane protein
MTIQTDTLRVKLTRLFRHEISRLARGASFVFVVRITGAVSVFVTQVLLARWAGPMELGIYVYAFAWCILLSTLAGFGFPMAAYRFIGHGLAHGDQDAVRGYIRRGRQFAVIGGVAIAVIGTAIVSMSEQWVPAAHHEALLLALICVPIYTLMVMNGGAAHGLSWFRIAFLPDYVFRPLLLLASMVAIKFAFGTLSAAIVMALHLGVMVLLMLSQFYLVSARLERHFPEAQPRYETGLWVRTAIPLLVISLFANYFTEVNLIVARIYLNDNEIGILNAALRTAFLIGFGIYAVDAITIPRAAKIHASGDIPALQRLISNAVLLRFWGALAAVIFLGLTGKYVLALFGSQFVGGYWPLMILALSQLIIAAFGPTVQLLSVSGNQNRCLFVFGLSLVVTIILQGLLIPRLGLNGAALSMLIAVFIQSLWLHAIVMRRMGIRPGIITFMSTSNAREQG